MNDKIKAKVEREGEYDEEEAIMFYFEMLSLFTFQIQYRHCHM
jgi:hypothetical protein